MIMNLYSGLLCLSLTGAKSLNETTLILTSNKFTGPLSVNISVPRDRVPEGCEVSIACDVDGYPNPRILWYKDGNLIQTGNRVQISEANRLRIPNAKRDDSGTYCCEATNQFSSISGSVVIKVSVPVKLNVSVPQNKFIEGSEVSITCDVDEYYISGIRWYKDENVIQTDNRVQISKLIIPNAKREDSGIYRCEAYDWLSEEICSGAVTIKVLVPVKLNVSVPQNKFPEGSEVSITDEMRYAFRSPHSSPRLGQFLCILVFFIVICK